MTVAAAGRSPAAVPGWGQERDLSPGDGPREWEYLVLARAMLVLAEALTLGYLESSSEVLRPPDRRRAEPGTVVALVRGPTGSLTSRERQVLGLLAAGQANRDIAGDLVISLDTVKRHVSHILAKLGAANRTEAVARARDLNLIA